MLKNFALLTSAVAVRNWASFVLLLANRQSPLFLQNALGFATCAARHLRITYPAGAKTFTNIKCHHHNTASCEGICDTAKTSVKRNVKTLLKPFAEQDKNKYETMLTPPVTRRDASDFAQQEVRNTIDHADSLHEGGKICVENNTNRLHKEDINEEHDIDAEDVTSNNVDAVDTTEKTQMPTLNSINIKIPSSGNSGIFVEGLGASRNLLNSATNCSRKGKVYNVNSSLSKNLHYITSKESPKAIKYACNSKTDAERKQAAVDWTHLESTSVVPKVLFSGKPPPIQPAKLMRMKGSLKIDSVSSNRSAYDFKSVDKLKNHNSQAIFFAGEMGERPAVVRPPSFNVMKLVSSFAAKSTFSPTVLDRFRNREMSIDRHNSTLSPPHNLYYISFTPQKKY